MDRTLKKYIFSNVLAMLGVSCYILADTYFISVAGGADGITALNLVIPVYNGIYSLGALTGIGSATRYALRRAAGGREAGDYFSNAVIWTAMLGLVITACGLLFPRRIFALLGADGRIMEVGLDYLRIALCFAPFFMLNFSFTAFVRNDDAPKVAMAATVISSLFNILFDYILMFPLGMGVTGAALATACSPIVSMAVCMAHYLSGGNNIRFRLMRPDVKMLLSSCRVGTVAFIGELAAGVTVFVFNMLMLRLGGNVAVAAYGVVTNAAIMGAAIFNGVSQGLQPLAGEAHGRGDIKAEERILRQSVKISLALAGVTVATVWLLAGPITGIFNSQGSERLAQLAVPGLRIYFLGFLPSSVNVVYAGFLSATGHSLTSTVIALTRGLVALTAVAVILAALMGVNGVWAAFLTAEMLTLVLCFAIYRNGALN